MADQRIITLYPGDATPKDIVLRDLPVATASSGTTIYLYQGDATAKDIILRDPTAAPVVITEVNGTLAWTEANDTSSITAAVSQNATLAWTEANDTFAASVNVSQTATLAWTEANDTSAITGAVSQVFTLAWTEENDVTAIVSDVSNIATLAWLEDDDVTAISATVEAGTASEKVGGDDRVEVWEKYQPKKKKDEQLEAEIVKAYQQIMGIEPDAEVVEQVITAVKTEQPSLDYQPADLIALNALVEQEKQAIRAIIKRIEQDLDDEEAILLLL